MKEYITTFLNNYLDPIDISHVARDTAKIKILVMHPDNAEILKAKFGVNHPELPPILNLTPNIQFYGFDIYFDDKLPKYAKKWEFPASPFVEYDKVDEAWARPLGYGREVDDKNTPMIFMLSQSAVDSVKINMVFKGDQYDSCKRDPYQLLRNMFGIPNIFKNYYTWMS